MNYVAGIDIGTSGCKTVIIDAQGVVLASKSQEYFPRTIDGATNMNPMDWWESAAATLKNSCDSIGINPSEISAVGCSGQMQGCTFIGKDGKPTRDSMLWYETTPKEESKLLNEAYGELFEKNCCMRSAPSLTGSKIKWVMKNQPEIWAKTDKFLFASSFISYMLTGVMAVDRSNLGLSGLNNVLENGWSQELMDATGVTQDKVPKLLGSMDIVGTVSKDAAAFTGLKQGIPVIAGCGDATGECFSVSIAGRSEIKLRLGSAAAVNAIIPAEWFGTKAQSATPYIDETAFAVGNYTKGCALSVKWVRDTFFSELPKDDKSYDLMDIEAENTPLGCNGLIYHPYLNGENAPYYDADLRAKFTGISYLHKRGDFVRAVYEGVSFSIRHMIENDAALSAMERIVFCGGGTKSKLWLSILADVLGKGGIVPKSADASFGVALMAGQAIGLLDGKVAADKSRDEGINVGFSAENHEKYNKIFEKYVAIAKL